MPSSSMQRIAILPSRGIGDALLMLIAAYFYNSQGHQVDLYHDVALELSPWFPNIQFLPTQNASYSEYDLIIAENDNSPGIQELIDDHRERLSIYYPTYKASKHAPKHPLDALFNPSQSMAENIRAHLTSTHKHNGISPPDHLHHRSCEKRIIIHPTSREEKKNWTSTSFLALAQKLQRRGFFPLFVVSPQEKGEWEWVEREGIPLQAPPSLSDLAALIYESGYLIGNDSVAGHLASNLGIPTLIIAQDKNQHALWRPDWHPSTILYPHFKCQNWQRWISPRRAERAFLKQLI